MMNKLKPSLKFSLFIASLFFFHCNKEVVNSLITTPPLSFTIENLQAINLSEDMNEVSTKNDEIVLLVFHVKNQDASQIILEHWIFEHTFIKRNEKYSINKSVSLNEKSIQGSKLLFLLVELDNEDSKNHVFKTLKEAIEKQSSFKNIEDSYLDQLIGHDDFLAWNSIDLNQKKLPKNIALKFNGLQMFDRYEYTLRVFLND